MTYYDGTMRRVIIAVIVLLALFLVFWMWRSGRQNQESVLKEGTMQQTASLTVSSDAFSEGGKIPIVYTCDGENINPPLMLANLPENTGSIAIIVDDPDAPLGTFVHWLAWNFSGTLTQIPEHVSFDQFVSGKNGFGELGYNGPCPPNGFHQYRFTVYALDSTLDLSQGADRLALEAAMKDHILAWGGLTAYYSR